MWLRNKLFIFYGHVRMIMIVLITFEYDVSIKVSSKMWLRNKLFIFYGHVRMIMIVLITLKIIINVDNFKIVIQISEK